MLSLPGKETSKGLTTPPQRRLNQNSTIRFARFFNRMGYCAKAKAKRQKQPHLSVNLSISQSLKDLNNFCPPSNNLLFRLFSSAVSSPSLEAEPAVPFEPRLAER